MSASAKRFPVLWPYGRAERSALEAAGCPSSVPWEVVAPFEERAKTNHGQTLGELAERGGLSPREMVVLVRDQSLREVFQMSEVEAAVALNELLATPKEGMACTCRGTVCGNPPRRWTCKGCKRFVPYCNGAHLDDGLDDLCDQCWGKAVRSAEEA